MGFIELGKSFDSWGSKRLYKILPPAVSTSDINKNAETISLWDQEPIYIKNSPPSWTWQLVFTDGTKTLAAPIIIACNKDWQLVRQKEGKELFCKKVKYFQEDCMSGDFLVIEQLL